MDMGSDSTSLNDIAMMGRNDDPAEMRMPDESQLDDEIRDFMAEGYIMGADCFGFRAKVYADRLMEFVKDEYRDYLYYTTLSRRAATASSKRLFRSLAADELRHSKRFAAAYFLITGKRYTPTPTSVEPVVVPAAFIQALRERYLAESRDAVKYRMFARQTNDRCLKRIALSTSDDERRHAQDILGLIQEM